MKTILCCLISLSGLLVIAQPAEVDQNFASLQPFGAQNFNWGINSMFKRADGKIVVAGLFQTPDETQSKYLLRVNADGTMDNTFTGENLSCLNHVRELPDGKILTADFVLNRFFEDGMWDTSFNCTLVLTNGGFYTDIAVQPDGKILAGYSGGLKRLNTDGSLDTTFNVTFETTFPNSMVLLPNGKIIAVGAFYDGQEVQRVVCLNPDGSSDLTGFTSTTVFGMKIVLQPDGKVLIFENDYNGMCYVNRYDVNGIIDPSFTTVSIPGQGQSVKDISIDESGKILLGGYFNVCNGNSVNDLVRLNSNGTLDPSFDFGLGTNGNISSVICLENGQVLAGGDFSYCNGVQQKCLARLGVYDNSLHVFTTPSSDSTCTGSAVLSLYTQPPYSFSIDGVGAIVSVESPHVTFHNLCPGIYTGTVINGLNDTLSTTFVIPDSSTYLANNPFFSSSIINDTVVILVENCEIDYPSTVDAYIYSWETITANTAEIVLAIIDSTGEHLLTFNVPLDINGNFILEFQFYCTQKSQSTYFVILEGLEFGETASLQSLANSNGISIYPNPTNDLVTVEFEGTNAHYTIFDAQGKLIQTSSIVSGGTVSLRDVQTGVYFFELKTENGRILKRVVKN